MSGKIELSKFFKTDTRDNGETFVTLTDDAPEWLSDAVQAAHCGDLPDDWTYAECFDACRAIDEETLTSTDDLSEYADSATEIYTKNLAQWYADHCLGSLYSEAESRAEDMGAGEAKGLDINKALTAIQFCAIEIIAGAMLSAWEENGQEEDDPEDEDPRVANPDPIYKGDNSSHDAEVCPCDTCHEERGS